MNESLMDNLKFSGPHTDMSVINGILQHKGESWIDLAEIATDREYWKDSEEYSIWAPVCAIHLLAKIGDYKSQLAINSALVAYCDIDPSDWIDDIPYIIAHIGTSAIHMFSLMLQDSSVDQYVRDAAARSLVMIAIQNENSRDGIIKNIMETIQKEHDIDFISTILDTLLELSDPSLYTYLKKYLNAGFLKEYSISTAWYKSMYLDYERGRQDKIPRDPLDIFLNHPANFYRNTNNHPSVTEATGRKKHDFGSHNTNNHPSVTQDIGRNDKCSCGSGKKYKKCCMRKI